MNSISELREILSEIVRGNKFRLDCFIQLLLGLLKVRTVNLREIALGFEGQASVDSVYRRIKRFFERCELDYTAVARWLFKQIFSDSQKIYMTIDRTNWFWGKSKINVLTLAVAYEGIAIPLCWQALPKAGNATASEHMALIQRFIGIFGKSRLAGILGDREFASGALFQWLNQEKIPFYIRIKEGSTVRVRHKKLLKAKKLFNHLKPKNRDVFGVAVHLFDQQAKVFLAAGRSERGELMIVATNQPPDTAIPIYLRRWEIENLFQSLKGRGFRFEDTHLTILARIEKLMALLAIGLTWAHKVGEWQASKKPIRFNQHRDSRRPQYSYFRYGLDSMRQVLLGWAQTRQTLLSLFISLLRIQPENQQQHQQNQLQILQSSSFL